MKQTKQIKRKVALITGATGGLGRAFADVLAKQGYDLFLTGRDKEKLQTLKVQVRARHPQTTIYVQEADLEKQNSRKSLMAEINRQGIRLSMLVNVAGADIQKSLESYTQEKIAFQCRVNFEAAVSLCHFAVHHKAEKLEIINISSVSGLYPMPYFAIYSASKSALTSFSIALREEMKGKNVSVTAILPGAMPTRDDVKAQIKGQGLWGLLAAKEPTWVAERSVMAVQKNKRKYIPGFWNKIMRITTICIPSSWRLWFIALRWSKISKDSF